MISINESDIMSLRERIRPYLTEKRYGHVVSVESEAAALCDIFLPGDDATKNKVRVAALLHDITKKDDLEKQLKYCGEFGIIYDDYTVASPKLFHAMTAAALIGRDFPEFFDETIVNAVKWHTTGHADITLTEAIVYLADYIEPTRKFDDCIKLRELFYRKLNESDADKFEVLRQIMIKSFDMTIAILIDEKSPIDDNTTAARNYFLVNEKTVIY